MSKARQTNMKLFMGKAPNVNEYDQIEYPMWIPKIVTSVVDLTLVAKDSGTIYVTTAATEAEVVFTLPAIADGPWFFMFVNTADVSLKVSAASADTLIAFNDLEADSVSFETSSEKIAGGFIAICDGTSVIAVPLGAGGHVQTLTVST